LEVGSLEDVNIDPVLLKKAVDRINCGKYDEVHSMIIYQIISNLRLTIENISQSSI